MCSQKRKVPVAAAAGTSMYHYAYKTGVRGKTLCIG